MYRFFVEKEACLGERIAIKGQDVNHIKNVLRLKIGEQIAVSDGEEKEYICSINELTEDVVFAKIEDVLGSNRELPVNIYLFQGFPKGDKMETIIQKAVELGVYKVIPVMTKRSIVKLDEKKAAKKVERYNAIALAAAKQSKRSVIPEVMPVMSFGEAKKLAGQLDMNIIPYENAEGITASKGVIKSVSGKNSLGVFIGPEGGFDEDEVKQILEIGGKSITLGHRILRTETAGMTVLSILMFELEQD